MNSSQAPEWIQNLDQVLALAKKSTKVSVGKVIDIFSGKAVFVVLMLLSLPFCLPIQIPGLSTPFGLVIGFLSLRLIFKKHKHVPKWLLSKEISSRTLLKIVTYIKKFFLLCKKFTRRRFLFLVKNHWVHKLHGIFIFFCALILALPLPIPFTNFFVASPILFISLGFLEEDGLLVMLGYAIVSFGLFFLFKAL